MKINIKATNIDLTPAISGYVHEKVSMLEKVLKNPEATFIQVEVAKTTEHHKSGEDLFKAEFNINHDGEKFYIAETTSDLYAAIDKVKDEMMRVIRTSKNRKFDLFLRGARSLKKRIKGFKPW